LFHAKLYFISIAFIIEIGGMWFESQLKTNLREVSCDGGFEVFTAL
jgi:hypothetical protein